MARREPSARALRRIERYLCAAIIVAVTSFGSNAQEPVGQRQVVANSTGRQVFSASCSSCHGLDGRGGERAPDIVTKTTVQHLDGASLFRIINEGVRVPGSQPFAHSEKSRSTRPSATCANCKAKERIPLCRENPQRARLYFLGRPDARDVTPSLAPEDSSGLIYRRTLPRSGRDESRTSRSPRPERIEGASL